MKKNILKLSVLLSLAIFISNFVSIFAGDRQTIENHLIEIGFENVSTFIKTHHLFITFENRVYRNQVMAFSKIIRQIDELSLNSIDSVTLISQKFGISVSSTTICLDNKQISSEFSDEELINPDLFDLSSFNAKGTAFLDKSEEKQARESAAILNKLDSIASNQEKKADTDRSYSSLNQGMISLLSQFDLDPTIHKSFANQTGTKADLLLGLNFKAIFGNYDDPYKYGIFAVPEMNYVLGYGISFRGQAMVTLMDEVKEEYPNVLKDENNIRPGIVVLNYFNQINNGLFLSATVGKFTKNRYGLNLETKKFFFNSRLSLGLNLGYTGYWALVNDKVLYTNLFEIGRVTGNVSTSYRFPKYDFTVQVAYEKFVYEDEGIRFDFFRQFNDIQIGFLALFEKDIKNAGVYFTIPFPPRKYWPIRHLRVRPANSFSWQYLAKSYPWNGVRYDSGFRLDDLLYDFHPDFIDNNFNLNN